MNIQFADFLDSIRKVSQAQSSQAPLYFSKLCFFDKYVYRSWVRFGL